MLKIIFKNLWNRRSRCAWLFIELIVVTCLAWYILDPAIVSWYDASIPLGYDADRLVVVEVATLPETDPRYDSDTTRVPADDMNRMLAKIKNFGGVENLSASNNTLNARSVSVDQLKAGIPRDTLVNMVNSLSFIPGQHFLETYGISSVSGSPTVEELSARSYTDFNEAVITEDFANLYWPGENAVGKKFIRGSEENREYITVVGVVGNFRYQSFNRTNCAVFFFWNPTFPGDKFSITVRLAPGESPQDWADRFRPWAVKEMLTGNYYVKSVTPFENIIAATEYDYGITAERRTAWMLAAFFLINLVLGVLGSFYLQTRRRIGEMGVHRAFGARRGNIFGMLMGESVVLATLAFIIGDILYLQYALKAGFNNGYTNNNAYNVIDTWVTHFGEHFSVISAIVYIIIIICVVVGTWIPAARVSRISTVDSLREE